MLPTTLLDIKLLILLHNIVLLISKLFQSYMAMQNLPLYKAGRIRYMEVAIIQSDITTTSQHIVLDYHQLDIPPRCLIT